MKSQPYKPLYPQCLAVVVFLAPGSTWISSPAKEALNFGAHISSLVLSNPVGGFGLLPLLACVKDIQKIYHLIEDGKKSRFNIMKVTEPIYV